MNLRDVVVPESQVHSNFRALNTPGFFDEEWETLHGWAEGFIDRDGKFVKEFQTTFNSSFWEIYLHAAFRELGYRADYSHSRPDFVLIREDGSQLVAEAAIASHADGYQPEWERSIDQVGDVDTDEVVHIATIRLANAIWSKYQKYKNSYSTLEHVKDKPFVICVAPFEQPFFFLQNDNAIRKVLYKYDQPLWIPGNNGERIVVGYSSLPEVFKDNGASIELGFFESARMPEVSAVIFSNTATTTKLRALTQKGKTPTIFVASRYNDKGFDPHEIVGMRGEYSESLLDGFHVFVNPFATYPIDLAPFLDREVAVQDYDAESNSCIPFVPDGFLFQHGCISSTDGKTAQTIAAVRRGEYKRPVVPTRKDDELFPVGGRVGIYTNNHLAYHRGWTICVALDEVDKDWMVQATPGKYGTLTTYHRADKSGEFIMSHSAYASKEEALRAMVKTLDRHLDQPFIEARRAKLAKELKQAEREKLRKKRKSERTRKTRNRR